jgi:hypothetical protein
MLVLSKYSRILELMAFGAIILISHKKSLKRKGKVIRSFKSPEKSVPAIASRVVDALAFGANHPPVNT